MSNFQYLVLLILVFAFTGCRESHNLKNTKWRVVKFAVDSQNHLSNVEKDAYQNFDPATRLYTNFTDSLVFTSAEGSAVDTSAYDIKGDSLFYIQGTRRDTVIIIKLTKDSLVEQRLAGVKTFNVRVY